MLALGRLIRLQNLAIIVLTQVLTRECLLRPLLGSAGMQLQMDPLWFGLLVLSTLFIAAGGYAINDYFDRKLDRLNKPESLIVGKLIYPRHAMAYHLAFSVSGVLLGCLVSWRTGLLYLSIIYFMVSGLLWFYSTTYKREFLLGNLLVALLTAMVPFLVVLYELPLLAREYGSLITTDATYLVWWVGGFSTFAFLLNLCRELVKDAEDFEGDQAYGKRSIAVVWGLQSTRFIASGLLLLVLALLSVIWKLFIPDWLSLLYFLLFLIIPLVLCLVQIMRANTRKQFRYASQLLKIIMLAGLFYMVVVNQIINRMK